MDKLWNEAKLQEKRMIITVNQIILSTHQYNNKTKCYEEISLCNNSFGGAFAANSCKNKIMFLLSVQQIR